MELIWVPTRHVTRLAEATWHVRIKESDELVATVDRTGSGWVVYFDEARFSYEREKEASIFLQGLAHAIRRERIYAKC